MDGETEAYRCQAAYRIPQVTDWIEAKANSKLSAYTVWFSPGEINGLKEFSGSGDLRKEDILESRHA